MLIDMVVRLVLSHVMQPTAQPAETAETIAWIADRVLVRLTLRWTAPVDRLVAGHRTRDCELGGYDLDERVGRIRRPGAERMQCEAR